RLRPVPGPTRQRRRLDAQRPLDQGRGQHWARRRRLPSTARLVPRQSGLRQYPRWPAGAWVLGRRRRRDHGRQLGSGLRRPLLAAGGLLRDSRDMSISSETAGFMAMKGAGYYSKATTGARDVINEAAPLIMAAIDRSPRNDARAFRCADMGCADGGTSVEMW